MRKQSSLFQPNTLFKLSRSKIELFCECPCCFFLDRKLGISPPLGFPFNLNNAVDYLLKREFDEYRAKGNAHPLMIQNNIKAIPFMHTKLDEWRSNFKGITYLHEMTHFLVTGAIDDLWVNNAGELIVVDFKATSKSSEIGIEADWQAGYRRQMEIYQWLLRKNGFQVAKTGYFLYCNGKKDAEAFNGCLKFDISLIPYEGDDKWIEPLLQEIRTYLSSDGIPSPSPKCKLCNYRYQVTDVLKCIN